MQTGRACWLHAAYLGYHGGAQGFSVLDRRVEGISKRTSGILVVPRTLDYMMVE